MATRRGLKSAILDIPFKLMTSLMMKIVLCDMTMLLGSGLTLQAREEWMWMRVDWKRVGGRFSVYVDVPCC